MNSNFEILETEEDEFECPQCGSSFFGTQVLDIEDEESWTGYCSECNFKWLRKEDFKVMITIVKKYPEDYGKVTEVN